MAELRSLSDKGRTIPPQLTTKNMPKRGAAVPVSSIGAIGKGEVAALLSVPGGGVVIVAIGGRGRPVITRLTQAKFRMSSVQQR
jgi:hypothetical protein